MRHTRKVHSKVGGKSEMYGFDQYSCDLCDKSFNAEQYLKLHKIHKHSVAGDINDNNRCRLCNQGLTTFTVYVYLLLGKKSGMPFRKINHLL